MQNINIPANNPSLKTWVEVPANSDFPIQNLPFGIINIEGKNRVASRIGDYAIDLKALFVLGYLENLGFELSDFDTDYLNPMMKHGKQATRELRNRLSKLFNAEFPDLQKNEHHIGQILIPMEKVQMSLPVQIGDYTDFYSSREHAMNVGEMFRGKGNELMPNWLWLPVGYHGRASSIILNEDVRRPKGQIKPDPNGNPIYDACRRLDFELETGFITYEGKPMGERISTKEAEDYIFGMVLFNDWSARDIQVWEYVPLGPFLGKNFASAMSPWIVTMDALIPFKVAGPVQDPEVLSYLAYEGDQSYDMNLQVLIQPENGEENVASTSNWKYMYWNMPQQLAHHTVNGCNIRCGDMLASGTISGKSPDSFGSMLELTWNGQRPLKMSDGTERQFILDGDSVIMRGYCEKDGVRVGFGEVRNKVLPAID